MKRKIRPGVIIGALVFVVALALALVLLSDMLGFLSKDNEKDDTPAPSTSHKHKDEKKPNKDQDEEVQEGSDDEQTPQDDVKVPEETLPEISTNAPQPVYTQEELLEKFPNAVLPKTGDAGDEYIKKIYFIGDSTTHGMIFYGVLPDGKETKHVWTPASGTLAMWNLLTESVVFPEDGSSHLIPDAVNIRKPEMVVLTLGVNGVSSCSKEQFTGYYRALIKAIKEASPNTTVLLQSIYPVCSYYQYVNSISMEKINTANSWIAELAENEGCYYLNTASALVDETGYLNPDYCNGDGIHISTKGFEVILEYIRTHAVG